MCLCSPHLLHRFIRTRKSYYVCGALQAAGPGHPGLPLLCWEDAAALLPSVSPTPKKEGKAREWAKKWDNLEKYGLPSPSPERGNVFKPTAPRSDGNLKGSANSGPSIRTSKWWFGTLLVCAWKQWDSIWSVSPETWRPSQAYRWLRPTAGPHGEESSVLPESCHCLCSIMSGYRRNEVTSFPCPTHRALLNSQNTPHSPASGLATCEVTSFSPNITLLCCNRLNPAT